MSIYYDPISAALGINPLPNIDEEDIWEQAEPFSWGEGELNPFYGKKHDEEAKAKMSAAAKGRVYSEEYKLKMSETIKKRNAEIPRSEEWCDNLSKALMGIKKSKEHIENHRKSLIEGGKLAGENNPRYGVEVSQETREKMSKSLKGKFAGENNPMFGKSATKGKKWYNNGQVSGRFTEGEQPEGYVKGRLRKGE
jgi:hypothetical protein